MGSNNNGYATYSGPSTAPAGSNKIISELSRSGYAQIYASPSRGPNTTHSHRSNELWQSSTYALPPFVSSPPSASPPRNSNNLGLGSGYALAAGVPPTPATPLNYANNLARNSGYVQVDSSTPTPHPPRRSSGARDGA